MDGVRQMSHEDKSPQFEDIRETFFGLTKTKFIGFLVAMIILGTNIPLGFIALRE